MTWRIQLLIVVPLSLAAVWAGIFLARSGPDNSATPEAPVPSRVAERAGGASSPSAIVGKTETRQIRELIAATSSDALRKWLVENAMENASRRHRYEILRGLYERDGISTWSWLLAEDDSAARENLSDEFLGMLSNSDPWLAYELFLQNKDAFGEKWGSVANTTILDAASSISAEKFIEVMERSGFKETVCWFVTDLPPGFDHAALLAHLENSEHRPSGFPENIVPKWAKESPLAAITWLLSKPKPEEDDPLYYALEEETVFHNILLNLAESTATDRGDALAAFSTLPPTTVEKSWERLVDRLQGKINPAVLDASTQMDFREDYLVRSLLESRKNAAPDPSWSVIADHEKLAVLDLAVRRWQEESSSPVDDKARCNWRERIERAWGMR